ncbi:MAG TPA: 4'-phosphopantetheinyl transferase superfamily protein [Chiayiivirga sp.]|nr:4'-phosphopantetheinyl transferase superfamily protein [Chiayiivirga sp.]
MTVLLGHLGIAERLECPAARSDWLGADERARLDAMQHPQRRAQFLAGHTLARELLAQYQGVGVEAWTIERGEHGAPRVLWRGQASHLHLSIAHSDGQVFCAVAAQPVGVDIEQARRERDWLDLATALYPAVFVAQLRSSVEAVRRHLFLQRWTLDEALAKAQGTGLKPKELRTQVWRMAEAGAAQAWTWQVADTWLALACCKTFQCSPDFRWYGSPESAVPQAWSWHRTR